MKKKSMVIIAMLVVVALSITACGGSDAKSTAENFLNALLSGDEKKATELSADYLDDAIKIGTSTFANLKSVSGGVFKTEIVDLKVEEKDDTATATFKIKFQANNESTEKPGKLTLKKTDGKWIVNNLMN